MFKSPMKTLNKILVNKYVLYVVSFIAVSNVLGYLASQNFNALTLFIVVSFLTTYFSRNMVVVLLSAIVFTNLYTTVNIKIEAMTNKSKKGKNDEEDDKDEDHDDDSKNEVNFEKTVSSTYENLDKILSSEAFEKMGDRTKKLMDNQQKLGKQIESLNPLMKQAEKVMNSLPLEKLTGMINKISPMASKN